MRRRIILALATLLALSAFGAAAEMVDGLTTITFPELHFTTAIDFDAIAQVEGYRELFIYTGKVEYLPYFYVNVSDEADRMTDGQAGIDSIIDSYKELYGGNGGTAFTQHGDFILGGKYLPNVEAQFTADAGFKVYTCSAIDVRDGYTILYSVFYTDPSARDFMLTGLNTIAENLEYTGGAHAPRISELVPRSTAAPKEPLMSCTVTEIPFAGMAVGHCVAPTGWKVDYQLTSGNSLEASWLLKLGASNPEGDIAMVYTSTQVFVQILRDDTGNVHKDNVYSPIYHAMLLTYMNAPAYCDYLARQAADGDLTLVEDNQYPAASALFRQKEQELLAEANKYAGISNVGVKNPEFSVCYRRYNCKVNGLPHTVCVMVGIQKLETYAYVPGLNVIGTSMIGWKPVFTYLLVCAEEKWNTAEPIFLTFIENTSASDQLVAANKRMADELLDISSTTSENVLRAEASSGDTYEDRFSDYLFDANDYTLDDGTHVKVSTAYDYVYQGDNGNVYFSDSAFAQPGGSVQLYPNR